MLGRTELPDRFKKHASVCVCVCVAWVVGGGSYMVTGTGHTEINSPSKFKKENWLILSCKPHGIILSIGVSPPLLGSNRGGGGEGRTGGGGGGGRENKL